MRGKDQWFDLSIVFHKFHVFGRDQDGRYQASSYGELRVSISRWNIINSIIWNFGKPVIQCKEQNRQYYHQDCYPTETLFIEVLKEEMRPIVMGDRGGWVRLSRKNCDRSFFLEILDYPDSDRTNKINGFFTSILLECYVSDWVHDGGFRTCNSWGIQVWKLIEIKKK